MREAPKPPITNRGVLHAKEENRREHLTAVIDWCQVTLKDVTPREIAEDILRIPYFLMRNDMRSGIKGYRPMMCYDDIRVFEPMGGNSDNGYQLLMSGQGCRNFEVFLEANNETWFDFLERVRDYGANFPRLDLAIDDHKTYFRISKLAKMAKEGLVVCRMRIGSEQGSFTLQNNKRMGDTINFGSRTSELFMTFYEKGYEQAEKLGLQDEEIDKKWNRYELKFRQKKACRVVDELIKRREVYTTAMDALNSSIRFIKNPGEDGDKTKWRWPMWEPWAWFMRDVGKIKLSMEPKKKDYYDRLNWLQIAVAPTLWVYMEIDRRLGTNEVEKMMNNVKLDKKHRQMLEDYINQLEAQAVLANDEERRKELENIMQNRSEGYMYVDDYGIRGSGCPFEQKTRMKGRN